MLVGVPLSRLRNPNDSIQLVRFLIHPRLRERATGRGGGEPETFRRLCEGITCSHLGEKSSQGAIFKRERQYNVEEAPLKVPSSSLHSLFLVPIQMILSKMLN